MAQFSKRERVDAALKGEAVDRVPVSAWRHFLEEEHSADTLAAVSLRHFHEFDWDWLKVNPRATYYAEAWGNRYDLSGEQSIVPPLLESPIQTPADLEKIQPLNPTSGVFAEQLDLVRLVKAGIGDAHFLQTVFSPLSVLSFLVAHPQNPRLEEFSRAQYAGIRQFIQENPQGAHDALRNIATTLGQYAAASVDAGASGIFFAIVKLARQGVLTKSEFAEFGTPYDLDVLQAVQSAPFNLLHICGPAAYFDAVIDYPVHALNWATIGQDNPTLGVAAERTAKTLVGGVDELGVLQTGTPQQVINEALEAIQVNDGRHLLLTPGCGTNLDVPAQNLRALRQAADLAAIPI